MRGIFIRGQHTFQVYDPDVCAYSANVTSEAGPKLGMYSNVFAVLGDEMHNIILGNFD